MYEWLLQELFDLHSTQDVDRFSFGAVVGVLHGGDGTQQLHAEPSLPKVLLAEQFHVGRQEILVKIITRSKTRTLRLTALADYG